MKTVASIEEEIRKLEAMKELLLSEDEIFWDEVNAVERDLDYLKKSSGTNEKK